jgi:hypothetical protein
MEGMQMKDSASGDHHGLRVGQAVQVHHGTLAGITGVLIGYSPDHNCRITLDTVHQGVLLVIDPKLVKACLPLETFN